MRKANGSSGKTVSATTRQLESLIRISEAHARMRLSRTVEPLDVAEAIRLVREAMLSYAVDPLTGKIDMDMITTGKSSALRERQAELKRQVKAMIQNKAHTSIEFTTLLAEMTSQSSIVCQPLPPSSLLSFALLLLPMPPASSNPLNASPLPHSPSMKNGSETSPRSLSMKNSSTSPATCAVELPRFIALLNNLPALPCPHAGGTMPLSASPCIPPSTWKLCCIGGLLCSCIE